ncbi:MAG TPA: cytochrome c oxidase subunit 3 family protein [Balneolales bacterium]|nr:cytochrome c oxidase subunit 3 family protein [Balneolales bacterium]
MSQVNVATENKSFVQHHFVDAEQQFDTAKLGMWIFLVTEILFFGGLFCAYVVFRSWYPQTFMEASGHLDKILGGADTVDLICSSVTMALAIHYIQVGKEKLTFILLGITFLFGAAFIGSHLYEWLDEMSVGIYPGSAYAFKGISDPHAYVFFTLYYLMTGLHGIHVLVGMGLMAWLMVKTKRGRFSSEYYTPIEITGLYWHFVDLIWIFLLPLLYLVD